MNLANRGQYLRGPSRIVLAMRVERWYEQKRKIGTVKSLARELGVSPKVIESMILKIRERDRA